MKDKFQKIESVKGLRKVLAFDARTEELVYASASINQGLATTVFQELLVLRSSYPEPVAQLIINFRESKMLLYNLRDYFLIMHVDESFNVQEMREVLSKTSSDNNKNEKADSKDESVLDSLQRFKINSDHLLVYKQIMEKLAAYAVEKLGAFVAAKKMKTSKERLHTAYKLLQFFLVGKDCSVVFRNTPETSIAIASRAIAAWGLLFFRKCQEIVPEFSPEKSMQILLEIESSWKGLGFAEAWREEKLVSELDS
jgi:hypothetical protein